MRISLAQINPTVGDLAINTRKIVDFIQLAREKNADVIVFPELAVTGYPPEDLLLKDHFIQDNIKELNNIVAHTQDIVAIVGFVHRVKKNEIYNAAAIISQGKLVDIYHKHELPNYGVFDEKRYFKTGQTNSVYRLNNVTFAVNICEDIWQEGNVAQRQSALGAKILFNLSSSPYDLGKLSLREKVVKNLAQKNKTYVCYCNLVGGQDELVFDGGSFAVNPLGKIIARAPSFTEDLLTFDVDLPAQKEKKSKSVIDLGVIMHVRKSLKIKSSRLVKETVIERVYKALVLGTHDYVVKNGFKKVLIGLSGGIDSALVAAIAVDALGKENVIGVTMPSKFTSKGTFNDAFALAKNLGIECREIPIEGVMTAYLKILHGEFSQTEPNVAEENLQARIRGNILMALSNKFGWLVLTTGNKSEIAVGYCTLYGDMSGGFAVIKDVPKMLVYQLSEYVNKNNNTEIIPVSTIKRAPTAELRANQKDQDSLPAYDVLDNLLEDYVEQHQSFITMSKNQNSEIVKKTIRLVDLNEYKRRQAAPGIKITPRAFGKDWRLPITNKYKEF